MELSSDFLSYLVSVSVRSLCLAAAAGAGLKIFRLKAPAARHAVWTVVLAGMMLLALLNSWLRSFDLPLLPAAQTVVGQVIDLPTVQSGAAVHTPRPIPDAPPPAAPDRVTLAS